MPSPRGGNPLIGVDRTRMDVPGAEGAPGDGRTRPAWPAPAHDTREAQARWAG
jgi:hypothetical protein